MTGYEDRDLALWASRLRLLRQSFLTLLSASGLDTKTLSSLLSRSAPVSGQAAQSTELLAAKIIYYILMPALRLYLALWLADTWVFFIHRAEHSNKWLYSESPITEIPLASHHTFTNHHTSGRNIPRPSP